MYEAISRNRTVETLLLFSCLSRKAKFFEETSCSSWQFKVASVINIETKVRCELLIKGNGNMELLRNLNWF